MAIPDHIIKHWDTNNIASQKEVVVCAANILECGTIICGARHWDKVMHAVADKIEKQGSKHYAEQGFINQWGVFLDRKEALKVVKASGQPFNEKRNGCSDELYSEGLY